MGWGKWFTDDRGDKVKEKTVERNDGGRREETLRTTSGDRSDHSHVVVNYNSEGKITSAHGAPEKSNR
jgi:hypothetical protein